MQNHGHREKNSRQYRQFKWRQKRRSDIGRDHGASVGKMCQQGRGYEFENEGIEVESRYKKQADDQQGLENTAA